MRSGSIPDNPITVFHVTHWKAGSQWIRKIFEALYPGKVVAPVAVNDNLTKGDLLPGYIYSPCYVTPQMFDSLELPPNWQRFVVIRDLRDTLISLYFSYRYSHASNAHVDKWRTKLVEIDDIEQGLIELMPQLNGSATIQKGWIKPEGEIILRFEDLILNDVDILVDLLVNTFGLPVSQQRVIQAVKAHRFSKQTNGRLRGESDNQSHLRKGVAGDWKNYFTPSVEAAFKSQYGQILIDTGYETSMTWE